MRGLLSLSLMYLLAIVLPTVSPILAVETVEINMGIDPPSGSNNSVDISVNVSYNAPLFGWVSDSDSDTATVSGNMLTRLWADFDPLTKEATVSGIEFYGGQFTFSTVEMDFTFLSLINIHAVGAGIGGEFDTPAPPGPVSGTQFNGVDHEVILNRGTFTTSGAVSESIDLALSPASGTTGGTGTIYIGSPAINGNTATYNVDLVLPLNYDEDLDTGDPDMTVHVTASGTYVASGQFERTFFVPPTVTLDLVDNGSPDTGLHSYTLRATGTGITTLSEFTIDGDVHQVFNAGAQSDWLGDGSASALETADSHVIFGNLRLPDLGGGDWDYGTYPGGPPDKVTLETIFGGGNSGMGTLNNSDAGPAFHDAYMKTGVPSPEEATVELMQLVVADGGGFTIDLALLTATDHDSGTGESTVTTHDLTFALPSSLASGDTDGNGVIDGIDLGNFASGWFGPEGAGSNGTSSALAAWETGDFDASGFVDGIDLGDFATGWFGPNGEGYDPAAAAVPEPGTIIMLTLGALCLVGYRARK